VLNIALTTRDKKDDPTPLAGFPHHALEQYLPKLVKNGHNVVVAEQVEDPKLAKGIVRREITRIVTPGTLTENSDKGQSTNIFAASVFKSKSAYGLAISDISTGTTRVTQTSSRSELIDEIGKLSPAEVLLPPDLSFSELSHLPLQILEDHDYSYEHAKKFLTSHFNVKSLASYGLSPHKAAIIAAGALISYLEETQKTDISHISTLTYYDIRGNMILDAATIRNLDLTTSAGESGSNTSLFGILNTCITGMGSRKVHSWILNPLLEKKKIDRRSDCVEYFFSNPDELSHTRDLLKDVADMERICGRIGLNRANARDLRNLAGSLTAAVALKEALHGEDVFGPYTTVYSKYAPAVSEVISLIEKSIEDSPPQTIMEGHIIADGYNKKIDEIRKNTSDSREWIENLQKKERERTGIPSLKVSKNKVFGYYIEITNTHKDKVPDDYIRKQTLVNSERYVTPELKEKEEIVFNAEEKLAVLEYECFQEIREKILRHIQAVQKVADVTASIDALLSFANVARLNDYKKPVLYNFGAKNGILSIKDSRHPIVELHSDEPFIHNDLVMNDQEERLIILTGPNMSGKSTFIRQMALIILMAQIGSYVPAQSAEIALVDRIFTRVGASDDLSGGRSTFMVEMDEAANIVHNATQHSFIVLDEVGRGTSTYDGVSIAWAIAEYIHDSLGARCLFATHYHELLKLETELDGVKNYNVAVLEEKDTIIFLRKIEKGGTDRSYGIYVAEMAGLPESVISRASHILEGFEQENMFGVKSEPKTKDSGEKETSDDQPDDTRSTHQLSFIDSNQNGDIPNMFSELKDIDVNSITPIEALAIIEKWKKRVGK
jgi:DNA mismatch repair protein MutS